jgi:hypothetical protein
MNITVFGNNVISKKSIEQHSLIFVTCKTTRHLVGTKSYLIEETLLVYRPKIIDHMDITILINSCCPSIFIIMKIRTNNAIM